MLWYRWSSQSAFDAWHRDVIAALNLPRPGVNHRTGQVEPTKQATTAYTDAVQVGLDDWRAPVGPDVAAAYPDGIGVPTDPPPAPEPVIGEDVL